MAGKKIDFSPPRLTKPCAQETCTTPAFVREETPTGWAEFCLFHYKKYHSERAAIWCKEHDLYSKQDMIEFCKKRIGKVFK